MSAIITEPRHTQQTPKYDIGQIVRCTDPRFPGPWVVFYQIPWTEYGKGEWRYRCNRPDGFRGRVHVSADGRVRTATPMKMIAAEDELFVPKTRVGPGMRRVSEGGIFLP